jgi:hypothetical protein
MADDTTNVILKGDATALLNAFNAGATRAKKFESEMSSVHKSLQNMDSSLKSLVGTLAGAFAITRLVSFGSQALETMHNLEMLSQKVGVNTDTLQVFGAMAKLSGTDLDGVSKALGIMSKNLLTAETKGKDTTVAFASLGISVRDSNGVLKSSDQILIEVADKFKNMADGTTKTGIAMLLFGRAGKDMIPILNQGGEAIKAMHDRMERLGTLISQDTIQAASAFEEHLSELGMVTKGLAMRVMGELVPSLDNLVKAFLESGATGEQLKNTAEIIGNVIKGVAVTVIGAAAAFDIVGSAIGGFIGWLDRVSNINLGGFNIALEGLGISIRKTADTIATTTKNPSVLEGLDTKLQYYGNIMDAFWKKNEGTVKAAKKATDPYTPVFNKDNAKEIAQIEKQIEKELNKMTLSAEDEAQRQADEWSKLGVNRVKIEQWLTAQLLEIGYKAHEQRQKWEQEYIKDVQENAKKYDDIISGETEFAQTENERQINAIIDKENEKLHNLDMNFLQEKTLTVRSKADLLELEGKYEAARKLITDNGAAARLEKTTEQAKKEADINYSLIDNIQGMETDAYNLRLKQIDAQAKVYKKDGADQAKVALWAADQQQLAYIKMGKSGKDFFAGVKAGYLENQRDAMTFGKAGYEIFKTFATSSKSALSTILFDSIKTGTFDAKAVFTSFADTMLKKFTDTVADMVYAAAEKQIMLMFNSSWASGGANVISQVAGVLGKVIDWAGLGGSAGDNDMTSLGNTTDIFSFAAGGRVPGAPSNIDSVAAYLAPGEHVLPSSLVQEVVSQGRGGDTMLAHINPAEAAVLKMLGGSGTINPKTGLPEFISKAEAIDTGKLILNPYYQPAVIDTNAWGSHVAVGAVGTEYINAAGSKLFPNPGYIPAQIDINAWGSHQAAPATGEEYVDYEGSKFSPAEYGSYHSYKTLQQVMAAGFDPLPVSWGWDNSNPTDRPYMVNSGEWNPLNKDQYTSHPVRASWTYPVDEEYGWFRSNASLIGMGIISLLSMGATTAAAIEAAKASAAELTAMSAAESAAWGIESTTSLAEMTAAMEAAGTMPTWLGTLGTTAKNQVIKQLIKQALGFATGAAGGIGGGAGGQMDVSYEGADDGGLLASLAGMMKGMTGENKFGFHLSSGLDYVPYDNFPASLHKEEAVLNKQDAKEWRGGSRNDRPIHVHLELDGKEIGLAILTHDEVNDKIYVNSKKLEKWGH